MLMNDNTRRLPVSVVSLIATRGLSSIGSTLTTFGLNVWVYRETGSYAVFAVLAVLAYLPVLLFAPFAGVLTDRLDKKNLLIGADVVSGVAVLLTLALYVVEALSVPVVAATILLLAVASEMRWSAMSVLISRVVPKDQLGRVNGVQQAFRGINVMLGPLLGAVGLDLLGLPALLGFDLATYVLSVAVFLFIRVDARPEMQVPGEPQPRFLDELTFGFRWVWRQTGLRRLLVFFMVVNIGVSVFTVALTPYLLSFANSTMLGALLGLLGAGGFVTGVYLGKSRKEEDHESRIVWGTLVFGLGMVLWGIFRQPALLFPIAFFIGVLETVIMASSQTAWQVHVPQGIQGKVFAVRTVLAYGLAPLAVLGSVPLANLVFHPLLTHAGTTASTVWGEAPAAPLGMMVSSLGFAVAACALLLWTAGGLRLTQDAKTPVTQSDVDQ
jgi:MFS transporter, DHA3 family, macrolide efflux protein